MKKIFSTVFLAIGITISFAQGQQNSQRGGGPNKSPDYEQQNQNNYLTSSLVIRTVLQRQFLVAVDNSQYQSTGNCDISIGHLNSGKHTILIYEWKLNFWGRRVQRVLYVASLYLKQGFETTIFINADGRADVNERAIYKSRNDNEYGYGNRGKGNGYGKEKNNHKFKKQYREDRYNYHNGNNDRD